MTRQLLTLAIAGAIGLLTTACATDPAEDYASALAAGHRAAPEQQEVFLGLELGMTDRAFYDRCTELNGQRLITMAGAGNRVNYPLPDALDRPANLVFRPLFSTENPRRVQGMEFVIHYNDWSPWNASANAEVLLPQVVDYLEREFSTELRERELSNGRRVWVSIEGNRHLAAWIRDLSEVTALVTDLSAVDVDPLAQLQ